MSVVIKIVDFANGEYCSAAGQYLETFDFEADDGLGFGTFTHDITKAKKFRDPGEALGFWRTQSKVKPIREDGKPNRPFTASTVEILQTKTRE